MHRKGLEGDRHHVDQRSQDGKDACYGIVVRSKQLVGALRRSLCSCSASGGDYLGGS